MNAPPFTVILETLYGKMIVHRMDGPQSLPLFTTGKAVSHDEVMLLIKALDSRPPDDRVVLDVGANFGVFSLALAPHASKVIAFEPQRLIFNMLAGSVALNGLLNVHCMHAAAGRHSGYIDAPQFDYREPLSFGSIEFGFEQRETLAQPRDFNSTLTERVAMVTLDELSLDRVDLIKIDAEGMELDVLAGAHETIKRHKPILYVEWLKVDKNYLNNYLTYSGYSVQTAPGSNFLAIHADHRSQG